MILRLTVNRIAGSILREETIDNVKYIVVPIVAMVEGVHQGISAPSQASPRTFYPSCFFAQLAATLEGKPVTVDHPMTTTQLVSALSPEGAAFCVGTVKNITVDRNKVKGEAWINYARLAELSPIGLAKIESGTPFDVSLGAMISVDQMTGVWKNEAYDEVITSLTSDHLAILPNNSGACSWDDGCGIRAAQQATPTGKEHKMKFNWKILAALLPKVAATPVDTKTERINALIADTNNQFTEDDRELLTTLDDKALTFIANEMSHDDISNQLWDFVNALDTPEYMNWLKEVYDDHFIYRVSRRDNMTGSTVGTRLYKRSFTVDQATNKITIADDAQEVTERTEYVPVESPTANTNPNQENAMLKEQLITNLIACDRTPFKEEHRAMLNGLTECDLKLLQADNFKPAAPAAPIANAEAPKPVNVDEYIQNAPAEVASALRGMMDRESAAKTALIEKIVANEGCPFTKEDLQSRDMTELQKIAGLARLKVDNVDYTGALGTGRANAGSQVPKMPSSIPEPAKA
jgi:hypothetical protein